MALTETARAKINLTLRVKGRRADGYHDIESLVAFAAFGDTLSLVPGAKTGLRADGPFAGTLDDNNLIRLAAERMMRPGLRTGTFHLTKRIPVAAGLGGGSADAAAALRLLARANPGLFEEAELAGLAGSLGADVPVCLASGPVLMRGLGERLHPLTRFPGVAVLLVNPGIAVATGEIFKALDASPLPDVSLREITTPVFGSIDAMAEFMRRTGNDLEAPAMRMVPVISEVKAAIAATDGCLVAAMSGSGATCFGLYTEQEQAQRAGDAIAAARAGWWTQATMLCGEPT